jgi:UDP-glucose:(heptosyl)LPS alpha-1,3-glucosyltransferase
MSQAARGGRNPVRIALLSRRFDPAGGGTERDLIVTARTLEAAGHDVMVYAAEVRALWDGGIVRQVAVPRFPRALTLIRFAHLAPGLARSAGADLVMSFARVVGADILRSGGGAHISYVRAARQWRGRLRGSAMWLSPYHRAQIGIERRGFTHPGLRQVVAVSNLVGEDLRRQFGLAPGKLTTLYNGVDLARFSPAADPHMRERLRHALGLGPEEPVVIFVGNGFARKGLGAMLRAWPSLKSGPCLIVVGMDRAMTGYARLARRLGVADRVSFLGARENVEDLYRAADVMAAPSLSEAFGNVVMEAMACGLPAMTSAQSGVAELMPPELRDFIVHDPSDPSEIAHRLDALVDARAAVARVARPTAERFTWSRYADELLRIVNSVGRNG